MRLNINRLSLGTGAQTHMLAACGRVSFFVLTPPKCWISLLTELNLRETRRGSASPAAFGLHILSRRSFLGAAARGDFISIPDWSNQSPWPGFPARAGIQPGRCIVASMPLTRGAGEVRLIGVESGRMAP